MQAPSGCLTRKHTIERRRRPGKTAALPSRAPISIAPRGLRGAGSSSESVEAPAIVDEKGLALLLRRRDSGEQIDEHAVIRDRRKVRMRPIAAPERAPGKFRDELARERDRVLPGGGLARDALRAAHLDPEALVAHQIEQLPESRLIEPERRIDAPHMVDDHGHGRALQPRRELLDERRLEMHLQVPAELRQTLAQGDRFPDCRALAEMLNEIEAHAAEPERIEPLELRVSDRGGQERHAAIVAVLRLERIRDDRVVEPVAGGLPD